MNNSNNAGVPLPQPNMAIPQPYYSPQQFPPSYHQPQQFQTIRYNQPQRFTPLLSRRSKRQQRGMFNVVLLGATINDNGQMNQLLQKVNSLDKKLTAMTTPNTEPLPRKVNVLSELKSLQEKVEILEAQKSAMQAQEVTDHDVVEEPKPDPAAEMMSKVLKEVKALDKKFDEMTTEVETVEPPKPWYRRLFW